MTPAVRGATTVSMVRLKKVCRHCERPGFARVATLKRSRAERSCRAMTGICLKCTRRLRVETETPNPKLQAPNISQLSTLNHQLCRSGSLFALRQIIPSRSFGTRVRESSRPKWNLSQFAKTIESQVRRMILELRRTAMGTLSFIILPSYLILLLAITSRINMLAMRLARKFRKKLLLSLFGARLREGEQ